MNIAKIIQSGIPKVGEAYMSDNISYDYSLPTAQKFQVIGYGDYYSDLTIHVVTDNFKTLKIEKYPLSNFLSMKLKKMAPFINETSIKKTNLIEKNKFYLNPYGILYTHSDRCSLLVNGMSFTIIRQRLETLKGDNREYEITDIKEIKKILEKQKEYYDELSVFYVGGENCFDKLTKKSINDLLNDYYFRFGSSFLMNKVMIYKLLEIVEKMSNNV